MRIKNSFFNLLPFYFSQIIISAAFITIFQQTFELKPIVIASHLIVVGGIHLALAVLGFILLSSKLKNFQSVTKYIFSAVYAGFIAILYYTYLFSFLGKLFNSRIYTLQIILVYFNKLNILIENLALNSILTYSVIFIVPILIMVFIVYLTNHIRSEVLRLYQFISRHNFNNPPRYIRFNIVAFLFLCGFTLGIVLTHRSIISQGLFRMEEPVVSFLLKNHSPFQGQKISNHNEDLKSRAEYPKNIEFDKKNVILIIVDALRADHLSLFGYHRKTSSFLDSLYSTGDLKKVDLSFSVSAASFAGINGILRSRIWSNIGYDNFSMQQLLKDQGYKINFILSGDHTSWYGMKSFYGKDADFDYFIDGTTSALYSDPNLDSIIFEGLADISSYNNDPSFFYFHLMSAHAVGTKIEKFSIFKPAAPTSFNVKNYTNRYDNGLVQTDAFISQIFRELDQKGYLQNSLVVITADHGEALGERGEFGHNHNVYTDKLLIPILIWDQDSVQYNNLDYATSVDISPTIIDRLGLPIPEVWEGHSLLSEQLREITYHQMAEHYAVIYNKDRMRLKYLYNNKTKHESLFDLNKDLYEHTNILDSVDSKVVDFLRNQLGEFNIEPF